MAPAPLSLKSQARGGGGGAVAYKDRAWPSPRALADPADPGVVARRSKVSSALSQGINPVSSKEVKSNNLRTSNDVLVQLACNPQPRVIQVVSAPKATQMALRRVHPMTGMDVEDNAAVNNVVEVPYEVVAPKTGRSSTLNGLTMPLHCV